MASRSRRARALLVAWMALAAARAGEGGAMGIDSHPAHLLGELVFPLKERPTPQCHASTIVETRRGQLLAAWFGGTREGHPDVGIWLSRREEGGWSRPVEVATGEWTLGRRFPCWNPVLFEPRGGPLMLFFKVGPNPAAWWGELVLSDDDGRTWRDRRALPRGGIGPVKNKPVELADGAVVCPSSSEHDGWRVHFEVTRDTGRTWGVTGPVPDPRGLGAIQPSVLVHPGGRLQILCRTRGAGVVAESWSDDGGRTWGELAPTSLPNPNAGTDAVTLRDGRHLIVYNPTTKGRNRLSVAVSADGRAWREVVELEDEPRGEFSYPAVIQSRDGRVHVTYTFRREGVRHVVLDPERL